MRSPYRIFLNIIFTASDTLKIVLTRLVTMSVVMDSNASNYYYATIRYYDYSQSKQNSNIGGLRRISLDVNNWQLHESTIK